MSSVFLIIKIVSLWAPKVSFAGGDIPADECKSFESEEMENYKQALQDLVRAVSIAHAQGKTLGDYWASLVSLEHFLQPIHALLMARKIYMQ